MRATTLVFFVMVLFIGLLLILGSCTSLGEMPVDQPGIDVDIDGHKVKKSTKPAYRR